MQTISEVVNTVILVILPLLNLTSYFYSFQVFDYDWGLQDDFIGSAYIDLTQMDLSKYVFPDYLKFYTRNFPLFVHIFSQG